MLNYELSPEAKNIIFSKIISKISNIDYQE